MEKEEFLKLLPKLIRESDEVKGAIITALSGVVATKDDIERLIEHSDRRFEMMEKRFEMVDKRFETVDKRFETLIEQMNKGFDEARKERLKIDVKLDTMSGRSGVSLENTILYLLKDKLIRESIKESEITKEYLIDREGKVFWKNYNSDIDVLIKDGKTILIEIKYTVDNRDGYHLLKNAELYKEQFNKEYDELMIICLEINQVNLSQLQQQGIKVISGKIIQ
ncbi:MAG: hypothetical protein EU539_11340 [Promethearchaeota archaeon]|nr:MAG: hypothetical protein EU539_11340 [Candidatus Lokiarchaeota archaeon]